MKYRKGDRVKVKSLNAMQQLGTTGARDSISFSGAVFFFATEMHQYCGKTFTISKRHTAHYSLEGVSFGWTEEMLEDLPTLGDIYE